MPGVDAVRNAHILMLSDLEKLLADVAQGRVADEIEPLARSNLTERGCQEDQVSSDMELGSELHRSDGI